MSGRSDVSCDWTTSAPTSGRSSGLFGGSISKSEGEADRVAEDGRLSLAGYRVRRLCGIRRGGDLAPRAISGPLRNERLGKEMDGPSHSAMTSPWSSWKLWEKGRRTGSGLVVSVAGSVVLVAKGVESRRTVRATGLIKKLETNDDIWMQ